jgi:hypothetical protein
MRGPAGPRPDHPGVVRAARVRSRLVLLCSLSGSTVYPVLAERVHAAVPATAVVPTVEGTLLLLFLAAVLSTRRATPTGEPLNSPDDNDLSATGRKGVLLL